MNGAIIVRRLADGVYAANHSDYDIEVYGDTTEEAATALRKVVSGAVAAGLELPMAAKTRSS